MKVDDHGFPMRDDLDQLRPEKELPLKENFICGEVNLCEGCSGPNRGG